MTKQCDWITRAAGGAIVGAVIGAFAFWTVGEQSVSKWIVLGVLVGIISGLSWPVCHSFVIRMRVDDWSLREIEIQGLKFTTAGLQRQVAWRLFVEITTRIASQPMHDADGDNGVALKSLYDLFQITRKTVSEMQPTPNATGDTVETYALDMLNGDLRPFLSKWHPRWDSYVKAGTTGSQPWGDHAAFRADLRNLQQKIITRAQGLAHIAGVRNVDRFFRN